MNSRSLPIAAATFWSRLKTTPLVDVLRGRLTGCLELARIIGAAELPEPLPILVYERARRRSWFSGRRADFAQRLASHLREELARGTSPEQLALSLSDAARWLREREQRRPLWSRLIHTPPADMLRGRLTGSLDLKRAIVDAGLSLPLSKLVHTLARRTRLWRSERIDVARELIEHFRDGLAAGRTSDELIASFGNVRQAARMVRRAKLRSRPLFWRLWRRAWQTLAALAALAIGCFLWVVLRLVIHHPTIAHNYALDIVAPTQGVAQADRAWPFYRQALLALTPLPTVLDPEVPVPPGSSGDSIDPDVERPGSAHWDLVEKWLDENQTALVDARQGGARPRLGFFYDDPANKEWVAAEGTNPKEYDPNVNMELTGFLLPQIQETRKLRQLLEADARRALAAGNQPDFIADVEALVGMADQLANDLPFLVIELVSFEHFEHALQLVDEALARHPDLIDDNGLRQLAHRIAAYRGGGAFTLRLTGERASLHDFLQRVYSDDGRGGGVLTGDGLDKLAQMRIFSAKFNNPPQSVSPDPLEHAAYVLRVAALGPGRREMTETADTLYNLAESDFQLPLWQAGQQSFLRQIERWNADATDRRRYDPLLAFMPAIPLSWAFAQRMTQQRDATLVALALAQYHRRHGAWPEQLDQLVPDLLPAVPPDRFTGRPIRYRVVDGQPLVYSVGPDGVDDGGRPPDDGHDVATEVGQFVSNFGKLPGEPVSGDWILWPPAEKPAAAAQKAE